MPDFSDIFKLTGLNAILWSTAILLAILLRIARAMIHWAGDSTTFIVAVFFAALGTVLKMSTGEEWRVTVFNGIVLLATVLILQFALAAAPEKFPALSWLPRDNQWARPTDSTGGTK